jgi:hypothetical protein
MSESETQSSETSILCAVHYCVSLCPMSHMCHCVLGSIHSPSLMVSLQRSPPVRRSYRSWHVLFYYGRSAAYASSLGPDLVRCWHGHKQRPHSLRPRRPPLLSVRSGCLPVHGGRVQPSGVPRTGEALRVPQRNRDVGYNVNLSF